MFKPLVRIARTLFSDQVRLKRDGTGVKLALQPAGTIEFTSSQLRRQEQQRQFEQLLHRMQRELEAVLKSGPEPERRMPHLLQVHKALQVHGLVLLKAMPLPMLAKALAELEEAVTNWSPEGLATLRSKMSVAVSERRKAGEAETAAAPPALPHDAAIPRTSTGPEVTEVDVPIDIDDPSAALLAAYGAAATPAVSTGPSTRAEAARRPAPEASSATH